MGSLRLLLYQIPYQLHKKIYYATMTQTSRRIVSGGLGHPNIWVYILQIGTSNVLAVGVPLGGQLAMTLVAMTFVDSYFFSFDPLGLAFGQ